MERGRTEAFCVSCRRSTFCHLLADHLDHSRTYSFEGTNEGEGIRSGFDPHQMPADTSAFAVEEEDEADAGEGLITPPAKQFGATDDDRNVWGSPGGRSK